MAQYDAASETYEHLIVPRFRATAERVLALASPRPDDRVLEVGAGTGGLGRLVLPRLGAGGSLLITDISTGMLSIAERVLAATPSGPAGRPSVQVLQADLAELPVADASIDLLLSQMTPLLSSEAGLAEAARIVRPGGRLVAATWGPAYGELDLRNAARADAGIPPYPPAQLGRIDGRLRRAGFKRSRRRTRPMTVVFANAEAYLAYRAGFGRFTTFTPEQYEAYDEAVPRRVHAIAPEGRPLRLSWSITLVEAWR